MVWHVTSEETYRHRQQWRDAGNDVVRFLGSSWLLTSEKFVMPHLFRNSTGKIFSSIILGRFYWQNELISLPAFHWCVDVAC